MKKILLLSFFLFLVLYRNSSAQWNVLSTGTTDNLYSVDYKSDGTVWVGTSNGILYSTNYATSLVFKASIDTTMGNAPIYGGFYDIHGFSPSTSVATGFYGTGNDELIYKTSSSGSGWDFTHWDNTVPLPRYLNDIAFENSNTGIAVGHAGRTLKTTNAGASWSVLNSGTTNILYSVSSVTSSVYVASGDNIIIRSTNGGSSWAQQTFSGSFIGLGFSGDTGYVASNNGIIMKTNDQGATWTVVNSLLGSISALYVINPSTVLIATNADLYITTDYGQSWEQYNLAGYKSINKISFYNSINGIAAGDQGYAIKTTNLTSIPSYPITSFTIQAPPNICLGDSITLFNSTAPLSGYSYQWQLDNSTFSTQYNSGIVLNTSGTHTISLIVTNGYGADTASQQITVYGHDLLPFSMNPAADSVCSGNYAGFFVPNSQAGVSYQLRKGFMNIGASQNGNGGTLLFSSLSGLTSVTAFNIKAVKINPCFTDSLMQYDTVYISAGSGPVAACIPVSSNSTYGITNFTFNTINNTSPGSLYHYFDFSCNMNTNLVLGTAYPFSIIINGSGNYRRFRIWIDFDNNGSFNMADEMVFYISNNSDTVNGSITVPATFQLLNQPLRMRVAFDQELFTLDDACWDFYGGEIEDYSVTVIPAPVLPVANFGYTSTVTCNTAVTFSNTTYNATSYLWDFGDTTGSTLLNPTHTYTASGTYTVILIATNYLGTDTVTQTITVQNPLVPVAAACDPTSYPFSCSRKVITYVQLNGMNNWPTSGTNFYKDFTCTKQVHLVEGPYYYLIYQAQDVQTGNGGVQYSCAWIDYNNDGVFNDAEERLVSGNIGGFPNVMLYFTVAYAPVINMPLRLRILVSDMFIPASCSQICGQYQDYTVFIDPPLPDTAGFTASDTTVCTNNYVSFTNTSVNASKFFWDFGDGTTDSVANPSGHNYSNAGMYSVKLIASNSAYSDTLIRTNYITVNAALPVPVLTLTDTVLSTAAVATSYQWYRNGILISGATASSYTLTMDGTYKLVITNSNGCQTSSADFLYYPVKANFTVSPTSICGTTSYVYFYNASSNATSYVIDWGDGTVVPWSGMGMPIHNYTVAGVYSVQLKACNANACDSLLKTNYINIYAIPAAPVITPSGSTTFCQGDSVILSSSVATTYSWSTGETAQSITVTSSGNYFVKITDANGCTSANSATQTVTVNPLPLADAGWDVTICPNDSAYLYASGGINYSWSPSASLTNPNIYNPVAFPASNTTYTVVVDNGAGCGNSTDSVSVTISSLPVANAGSDVTICAGGNAYLSASGGDYYEWTPSTGLSDPYISNPVASPFVSTSYTVVVYDANFCMGDTDIVSVFISQTNVLAIDSVSSADAICFYNEGSMNIYASGGTPPYVYSVFDANFSLIYQGMSSFVDSLYADTYYIQVVDSAGCAMIDSSGGPIYDTVSITNGPSPLVYWDAFGFPASCGTCTDGWAYLDFFGGTPPYTFSWLPNASCTSDSCFNLLPGTYTVCMTDSFGCMVCDTVVVNFLTGITYQAVHPGITLLPNPTSGMISIISLADISHVEITNYLGAEIYLSHTLQASSGRNKTEINLSKQPKGIYFYRIISENQTIATGKLVIQ